LLVGIDRDDEAIHTTTYWYYRACRAAVAGAGGTFQVHFVLFRKQNSNEQSLQYFSFQRTSVSLRSDGLFPALWNLPDDTRT
jgi:hypothetical protein